MPFIDIREVSEQSGLSVSVLAGLASKGKFTTIRPSRRICLIDADSFKAYIRSVTTYAKVES